MTGFGRNKATSGIALSAVFSILMPLYAFAESSHEQGEHASAGLPQLNPESYPSQIFWLLLCFGVLYYLMSSRILPQMTDILEKRESLISGDLERAETLKEEAEKTRKAYETALSQAEAQAAAFINDTSKHLTEETLTQIAAAAETIHVSYAKSAGRLENEKNKALDEIRLSSKEFADDIIALLLDRKTKPSKRIKG